MVRFSENCFNTVKTEGRTLLVEEFLLHDNAQPQVTHSTQDLIAQFG